MTDPTTAFSIGQRFDFMLRRVGDDHPGARVLRSLQRRLWTAQDKARLMDADNQRELGEAVRRIYGRDALTVLSELSEVDPNLTRFSRKGVGMLSKAQVLQQIATVEQQQYNESFANNPDNKFRVDQLDAMRDAMTAEDLALLDWLRDFYDRQRPELSAVSRRVTGLPIASPDPLYMPVSMSVEGGDLGGVHATAPIIPPSHTARVSSRLDLNENASVLDLFQRRSRENAQYIHLAELHIETRGIFSDGELIEHLNSVHGTKFVKHTRDHLADVFMGQSVFGSEGGQFDALTSTFAISKLWYNPRQALRQATSFWAFYGRAMDTQDIVGPKGAGQLKHQRIKLTQTVGWALKAAYSRDAWGYAKEIWKSPQAVRRMRQGDSQMLADVAANMDTPTVLQRMMKMGMRFNAFGDMGGITLAGHGVYKMLKDDLLAIGYNEDMAREIALDRFWEIAEQSQQSSAIMNQSQWQRRGGSLGKLLGQFTSTPQQFFADEYITAIETLHGKRSKGELATKIIVNHLLLPGFYHGVNIILDWAIGGDEPDKEEEGVLLFAAMLAGPLSGWFVVGSVVVGILDMLSTAVVSGKMKWPPGRDMVPAAGWVSDVGGPLSHLALAFRSLFTGEGDVAEEFYNAIEDAGRSTLPLVREGLKFKEAHLD